MCHRCNQPAIAGEVTTEVRPGAACDTPEALRGYVGLATLPMYHPVGTVKMGAAKDAMAVLTPDCRVKGVAGLWVAARAFARVDSSVDVAFTVEDGAALAKGTVLGTASGPARSVLIGERLALNLVQRMSGIATATRAYVEAVAGTGCRVLDTRKTAPGLRALDKWAVLLGGGANHRVGLYDRILIKDNHVDASGGVPAALAAAKAWRAANAPDLEIELELRTLDEVQLALEQGGADYLLLDNMARRDATGALDVSILGDAVRLVAGRVRTEASGNVTLETARAIAETGVDFLSVGALTHSVRALDVSLKIGLRA